MLSKERIEEAKTNVQHYLNDGLYPPLGKERRGRL